MAGEESDKVSTRTSFHFQSPSHGEGVKAALSDSFEIEAFDGMRVMMATVSRDGIAEFRDEFEEFCRSGRSLNFLVGTGLSPDPRGIRELRDLRDQWPDLVNLKLVQTKNEQNLFHPKLYWFHGNNQHRLFVGSANWTDRGHSKNIESLVRTDFSATPSEPPEILQDLKEAWTDVNESCQGDEGWGDLLDPTDTVLSQLESNWTGDETVRENRIKIDVEETTDQDGIWPLQNEGRELVMDLTMEQGGDRVSQVQPPLTVWRQFFDIEPSGEQPEYRIEDVRTGDPYRYAVVGHDHNWTLEIPGARVSRPAVIVMRLEPEQRLEYAVYNYQDDEYDEIHKFLSDNGEIPHHQQERRQYISVE